MQKLGARHAELEARRDLDGTMATLVPEPVYEFHPLGLRMQGGALVRRYYQELFSKFVARTKSVRLLAEWASESSVAQEYEVEIETDEGVERHRIIGILVGEGELLGGERVYASERAVRLMTGDVFDDLEPIG